MRDKNNIIGNTFNGPTQIITGKKNNIGVERERKAQYTPEPVWRSPITMGILTWISFILSIPSMFSLYKIIEPLVTIITERKIGAVKETNQVFVVVFIIFFMLLLLSLSLRRIAKNQTRHPLILDYAISGLKGVISLEKIKTEKCPKCGGRMKYYNRAIEWRNIRFSDGRTRREVTKRTPALECRRNPDHWFKVDPADDIIE